jgi:D-sedoheptulose 7-phosphate isomerase
VTYTPNDTEFVEEYFARSVAALEVAAFSRDLRAVIVGIAAAAESALRAGNKIMIAGNGGSAADAQHLAAEFLGRFVTNRLSLAAVALTTDSSVLTAVGNDFGFDQVFERQVKGLGRAGDILLALSTSGNSRNILAALEAARELGLVTVGFSRAGHTAMRELSDHYFAAPSQETAIIQQIHIVAGHAVCGLVERSFAR